MGERIVTRRRVVTALCLLLAALVLPVGVAGYLTFIRSPDNAPSEVCGAPTDRPAVVAAGASITQGSLGANWVDALQDRPEYAGFRLVNAGINGNTSADLRDRLHTDVVACRPAAVMILVGTNDVRDEVPVTEYEANLATIIDRLREHTTARIALMSLPPLGENLDSELNRRLAGYNAAIEDLATRTDVDHLPVHERMAELLGQRADRPGYAFSFPLALTAATRHYVLGQNWDAIARSGGRKLLIDHIHLSDRGASVITELAASWPATADPPF